MNIREHYKGTTALYTEAAQGVAAIQKYTVENNFYAMRYRITPGDYVRLMINGELAMSNTYMELDTNYDFLSAAHGDVLIGGLGLGLIVRIIQDKPEVTSITIVEYHQDVIDLVTAQVPFNEKVKIVLGDAKTYKPEKGVKFDCIYMDIWNWLNSDVYWNDMVPMKKHYRKYLKKKDISPDRYLRCWGEWYAKHNREF